MSPLSISRFPDELVIEIFRDQCFSVLDLTRLALVSRRFLPSIKPLLYEVIPLELIPLNEQGRETDLIYSVVSSKLLKVLEEHEDLALMVREIRYDRLYELEEEDDDDPCVSAIATTDEHALSTFLRLCKNATVLNLIEALNDSGAELEILASRGLKLRSLSFEGCPATRADGPTESTRKITRLRVSSLFGTIGHDFIYPNLTHLDLEDRQILRKNISYVDSVLPNLEVLKINAAVAVGLDFSMMPRLHYLHLYSIGSGGLPNHTVVYTTASKFWANLSRSSSIRTLSFDPSTYQHQIEMYMFQSGRFNTPVPTLTTVRFATEVLLDCVKLILACKTSSTLSRLVIPAPRRLVNGGPDHERLREARAVVGMCEGTGINVVLEDDVVEPWDAWSPSSSKSKPRLPLDLQTRILVAFFGNLHDQGGVNIDVSPHQLPSLSLVCKEWATLVRPEYTKWTPIDLRLTTIRDGVETHVFDSGQVEERLEMLRRARCTCCYSRGGLRVAFDNPEGKSFNLRSKIWRRTADNVIAEFKAQIRLLAPSISPNSSTTLTRIDLFGLDIVTWNVKLPAVRTLTLNAIRLISEEQGVESSNTEIVSRQFFDSFPNLKALGLEGLKDLSPSASTRLKVFSITHLFLGSCLYRKPECCPDCFEPDNLVGALSRFFHCQVKHITFSPNEHSPPLLEALLTSRRDRPFPSYLKKLESVQLSLPFACRSPLDDGYNEWLQDYRDEITEVAEELLEESDLGQVEVKFWTKTGPMLLSGWEPFY